MCYTLLSFSCAALEHGPYDGFAIKIINETNSEIVSAKITIGGVKNERFIGTESYLLPKIGITENDHLSYQNIAFDGNRWKPNLELVKAISDSAYFVVQLEGEVPVLLYDALSIIKL